MNPDQESRPAQNSVGIPELLNSPQPKPAEPKAPEPKPAEQKPTEPKAPEYKMPPPTILPPAIWQNDSCFLGRFLKGYYDAFYKKEEDNTPAERRALPEPWSSPPFPGHEYQGYPLDGRAAR